LAVALAESAFAGGFGAEVTLKDVPRAGDAVSDAAMLFSESASRFLLEVEPARHEGLAAALAGVTFAKIGETTAASRLTIDGLAGNRVIDAPLADMEDAWRGPLDW
jgi:phosphoribosylformylglycinamidine synthase